MPWTPLPPACPPRPGCAIWPPGCLPPQRGGLQLRGRRPGGASRHRDQRGAAFREDSRPGRAHPDLPCLLTRRRGRHGQYLADRKPKTSSKASHDTAAAARPWHAFTGVVGLTAARIAASPELRPAATQRLQPRRACGGAAAGVGPWGQAGTLSWRPGGKSSPAEALRAARDVLSADRLALPRSAGSREKPGCCWPPGPRPPPPAPPR
jgi:hypothetical protein